MSRPEWDTYFMRLAYHAATRATCDRKHVGAIITSLDHRVVATGYNGSPSGTPSCDDIGHQMVENHCVRTLHGESNAIDYAGRFAMGCTLYVTVTPCFDCAKRIVNASINRVVYDEHYESRYGKSADVPDYLRAAGVEVCRMPEGAMDRFKRLMQLLDAPVDAAAMADGLAVKVSPVSCAVHRFDSTNTCVVCGIDQMAVNA